MDEKKEIKVKVYPFKQAVDLVNNRENGWREFIPKMEEELYSVVQSAVEKMAEDGLRKANISVRFKDKDVINQAKALGYVVEAYRQEGWNIKVDNRVQFSNQAKLSISLDKDEEPRVTIIPEPKFMQVKELARDNEEEKRNG